MKRLLFTSLLFIVAFTQYGCPKMEEPDPCEGDTPAHDAKLLASYANSIASGPVLTIDANSSSQEINIANNPSIDTLPNLRIDLVYSGVTFKNGRTVYVVDEVINQRKATCWIKDDENGMTYSLSKSLDIVLVLDVSSSLDTNIITVKNNAKLMVNNILASNPDARIAVVKFSRGSVTQNFTSNVTTLHQFIDNNSTFTDPASGNSYQLEGRRETALYESINDAINLLNSSGADGTGILTFTDGISNFQLDPQFQDEVEVLASLNTYNIAHYTIGYEGNQGGVDRGVLERLAVNGDFSFPQNLTELEDVFERFSNSVAAVYDLRYNTNNAPLDSPIEYRFLFRTTIISQ